jgi:hypothetical protein
LCHHHYQKRILTQVIAHRKCSGISSSPPEGTGGAFAGLAFAATGVDFGGGGGSSSPPPDRSTSKAASKFPCAF